MDPHVGCLRGARQEGGILLVHAFVRDRCIGWTFLQPSQILREFNVRVKFNLIGAAVRGECVIVDNIIIFMEWPACFASEHIVEDGRNDFFAIGAPEIFGKLTA